VKNKPIRKTLAAIAAGASLYGTASADLVHHWTFDEGSGDTAADSAGANPGTINGATWGSDETRASYLIFNGSTNNVDPALELPAMDLDNDYSWAVWVNSQEVIIPTSGSQRNAIVLGNRRDVFGSDFVPREFIKLTPRQFEFRPNDRVTGVDYTDFPLDEWAHIAVVKDGNTITTYFNGTAAGNSTLVSDETRDDVFTNIQPFFIGGQPTQPGPEHFNGFIDDVRLYDSALTAEEILELVGGIARPPFWTRDPIPLPNLDVGSPIMGTLADFATNPLDPEAGPDSFAKVSGPEWLTVAEDGTLGGTPALADEGSNDFVVSATNADGTTEVTITLNVVDPNAVLPNDQLFGWWPLIDGSGSTALDISGNGRDATIFNPETGGLDAGSVWVEDADPEAGTVLTFSGVNGEGAVATVNGTLPVFTLDPEDGFTWSFWAKGTSDVNGADIILGNRRDSGGVNFDPQEFIKFTGTSFQWQVNAAGQNLSYGSINAALGWAHHALVKSGATLTYYRNGVETASRTITAVPANPQPICFGGQLDANGVPIENWNGSLSDIRLFNVALSLSEISAVRNTRGQFPGFRTAPTLQVVADGNNLTFTWDSVEGKVYNLLSDTNFDGPVSSWPVFDGNMDIAATPPMNTLTIARPADPRLFFAIDEFNAPPVTVFSDDFENGLGNWVATSTGDAGTEWELGTPTNVGPPTANSGTNCFGTNIDSDYTDDALVTLRSELIDLTGADSATLNFAHYIDADPDSGSSTPFDTATVNVLDSSDAVIGVVTVLGNDTTADWTDLSFALPAGAAGQMVRLEFVFDADAFANSVGPGWYIDDVVVTVP
jgi:hypothetical protein